MIKYSKNLGKCFLCPNLKKEEINRGLLVMNASAQNSLSDHDGATSRKGIPLLKHTLHKLQEAQSTDQLPN